MRGFVDRIADGVAVLLLEGGGRMYLPADRLPAGVQAGHLVEVTMTALGAMPVDEMADLIERLRQGEHRHG